MVERFSTRCCSRMRRSTRVSGQRRTGASARCVVMRSLPTTRSPIRDGARELRPQREGVLQEGLVVDRCGLLAASQAPSSSLVEAPSADVCLVNCQHHSLGGGVRRRGSQRALAAHRRCPDLDGKLLLRYTRPMTTPLGATRTGWHDPVTFARERATRGRRLRQRRRCEGRTGENS